MSSSRPTWKSSTYTTPSRQQRHFTVKLNHTSTDSRLRTPFAPRKVVGLGGFSTGTHRPSTASVQPYNALNDRHLMAYFTRKISRTSGLSTPSGRVGDSARPSPYAALPNDTGQTRPGSGQTRPSTAPLLGSSRPKQPTVLYRVEVKTGDKKGAGTNARVFLILAGTHGKLSKRRLWRSPAFNGETTTANEFVFRRATTEVFELQGPDIGEPLSLSVEHDGLREAHSWYLEEIRLTNCRTGKRWRFPCRRWLSLYQADGQLSRSLTPNATRPAWEASTGGEVVHKQKTVYQITVTTGDVRGAGTDANVFITLFGELGATPKTLMVNGKNDNFDRGQEAVFRMRATRLGCISKIRLEHDNTGFGPSWFLQKVEIIDPGPEGRSETTETVDAAEYYFPCSQWLSRDDGEGQLCRDLVPTRRPSTSEGISSMCKYAITTVTADRRGAGTDANVFVTIFGEHGDSGPRRLDNARKNFERGRKDTFLISSSPLGKIDRILVGHDNSGVGAAWFLDKVVVEDVKNRTVYNFPCQRWLAKDEDDGEISRELVADVEPITTAVPNASLVEKQHSSSSTVDIAATFNYRVEVTTGDRRYASTKASVYVHLHGYKDGDGDKAIDSGKFWLDKRAAVNKSAKTFFRRGNSDTFLLSLPGHLSPVTRVTIGHDNRGLGAGWFLDKVVVEDLSTGSERTFICRRWLDESEGDGLTQRDLHVSEEEEKGAGLESTKDSERVPWDIWVWTSDLLGAGTDASVYFQLYGESGKTRVVELNNEADNFERGELDKFQVELEDIGSPYKMRIWHDNANPFPGWHLDKVRAEKMSGEKFTFVCGQWLSRKDGDREVVREIPTSQPGSHPLPVLDYRITVHTADKVYAGTDANVYLTLFGCRGDTGRRHLLHSAEHRNKFERGQVDTFSLKAVSLGSLTKIEVEHDNSGVGSSWFLEKVVVTIPGAKTVTFPYNRCLSADSSEPSAVELLPVDGPVASPSLAPSAPLKYQVSVFTSDVRGAGTDANVFLRLYGTVCTSPEVQLKHSETHKNKFERGQLDIINIECPSDVGELLKLRLSHDGSGICSDWHIDHIEVCKHLPQALTSPVVFPCRRWLAKGKGDGLTSVDLLPDDEARPGQGEEVDIFDISGKGEEDDENGYEESDFEDDDDDDDDEDDEEVDEEEDDDDDEEEDEEDEHSNYDDETGEN